MSQSKKYICQLIAGEVYELPGGKMVLLSETSADVTLKVLRNGRKVKGAVDISEVWKYKSDTIFDAVTILSATNQTVEVFIDDEGDVSVNKIGGSVNADPVVPTGFDSKDWQVITAETTELILAANADRTEALITNLVGNSTMNIGDSGAGAANGLPLAAGSSVTLDTTAAIYAYNTNLADKSISAVEFTK